jgi:hypothetical protein
MPNKKIIISTEQKKKTLIRLIQWRREEVKVGGRYFENVKFLGNGRMWKNVSNYR